MFGGEEQLGDARAAWLAADVAEALQRFGARKAG